MSALLPKLEGRSLDEVYDWAKRMIVYFEGAADLADAYSSDIGTPAIDLAANPTAADLTAGNWAVFHNTTSGNTYLAYNLAGVIKKVQLT